MRRSLVSVIAICLVGLLLWPASVLSQTGARNEAPLTRAVATFVEYVFDCMAEDGPSLFPKSMPRSTFGIPSGMPGPAQAGRRPRIVIAGFDPAATGISDAHQKLVRDLTMERLSPHPIEATANDNIAFFLAAMEAMSTRRGLQAGKDYDAQRIDLVAKLAATYIQGGRAIEVKLSLMRAKDGSCAKQASDLVELDRVSHALATPRDVMTDAVKALLEKHKGIRRVAILPTVMGAVPVERETADPLEAELKGLIELYGKSAGAEDRTREFTTGNAKDAANVPKGLTAYRMNLDERFNSAAQKGDWAVRLAIAQDQGEPSLAVEMIDAVGPTEMKPPRRTVSPQLIGRLRAVRAAAEVLPQSPLIIGKHLKLGFALRVNQAASMYCALHDYDGDIFIIFPTLQTRPGTQLSERSAPYQFPLDFDAPIRLDVTRSGSGLVRCYSAGARPVAEIDRAWRNNSVTSRASRYGETKVAVPGMEFAKLVEALRSGGEVHETHLVVRVVEPGLSPQR